MKKKKKEIVESLRINSKQNDTQLAAEGGKVR